MIFIEMNAILTLKNHIIHADYSKLIKSPYIMKISFLTRLQNVAHFQSFKNEKQTHK